MTEENQEDRAFPVISRADWQKIAEGYDLSFVEMLHELSAATLSMVIFLAEQKDVIESIPVELIATDQYKLVVTNRDD